MSDIITELELQQLAIIHANGGSDTLPMNFSALGLTEWSPKEQKSLLTSKGLSLLRERGLIPDETQRPRLRDTWTPEEINVKVAKQAEEIRRLQDVINEIWERASAARGEWIGVKPEFSPEWTHEYYEIAHMCDHALKGQ